MRGRRRRGAPPTGRSGRARTSATSTPKASRRERAHRGRGDGHDALDGERSPAAARGTGFGATGSVRKIQATPPRSRRCGCARWRWRRRQRNGDAADARTAPRSTATATERVQCLHDAPRRRVTTVNSAVPTMSTWTMRRPGERRLPARPSIMPGRASAACRRAAKRVVGELGLGPPPGGRAEAAAQRAGRRAGGPGRRRRRRGPRGGARPARSRPSATASAAPPLSPATCGTPAGRRLDEHDAEALLLQTAPPVAAAAWRTRRRSRSTAGRSSSGTRPRKWHGAPRPRRPAGAGGRVAAAAGDGDDELPAGCGPGGRRPR